MEIAAMYIDHRYEVLEILGTGTWAQVYKVRDIRTDRLYSLKLFRYISSEDLYAKFSAEEMHRITMIDHPNLSHIEDFGHVADHIYYISEFFEGSSLVNFQFSKGRVDQIYNLVVQCAYALHALHTQNILHKDLKLENVLYRFSGRKMEVELIDYGFSKIDFEKENHLVSGTLPYIAPEVYLGEGATPESDFYSLGVILYKICTGTFPISLDQISALMSGSQQYFIPIFPSELNPDIPLALEKLILRLLERNPDNRFHSGKELIAYVNRISQRSYPFSVSWSMANTLRFNSYIVREQLSHQLLDYLPALRQGNGKIISVIGGDGLGKDNILSLFRYHLLGGEFYLFDYSCTKRDHEAFFALIKEYLSSLSEEEIEGFESLKNISDKFRSYLFDSEKQAKSITQSQEELKDDFASVRDLLGDLSTQKPLIFIVRNFQYVHRHTIDFINYLAQTIVRQRILVVLSCNDFNKIQQIQNTILLHVPMLKEQEAIEYMNRLLGAQLPDSLSQSIYKRSAGNPHFIREILLDLVLKKQISDDDGYEFPADLDDYRLPPKILQSIYLRMKHLLPKSYEQLQRLSNVRTPLSRELIVHILNLGDREQYSLLSDAIYNEILIKREKHYYYTFPEARQKFLDETPQETNTEISRRVLQFYEDVLVEDAETCMGLIENAQSASDLLSERKYYLRLYDIQSDDFEQEKAYAAIINVLRIDFELGPPSDEVPDKLSIPASEIMMDLRKFHDKTEAIGFYLQAGFVEQYADRIPEFFEKYYVLGTLKLLAESHREAKEKFDKALELAITGKQRVQALLYLSRIATQESNDEVKRILDMIDPKELTLELKIIYTDRLAVYWSALGEYDQAIKIIEEFLATLPPEHDNQAMIYLAATHNDLGALYSIQKNIPEATEHLNIALSIWKRHNIKRYLGLIYNNIADLYLKQGFTLQAREYSNLGYKYSSELNITISQAHAKLNQGETNIKMGDFELAEKNLLAARELITSVGSTRHLDAIQRNLALAKSKIRGFGYYYQFISEAEPKLIKGHIDEINPLVKTYFYYLHETANLKRLDHLIRKNVHINYKHINEEEFYHNILSLTAMSAGDFNTAQAELKQAMFFAGEVNNNYAIAVFNVLQVSCYYGLKEYAKARELADSALKPIRENRYRYWETKMLILIVKLDLMNPEEPLRGVLRRVNRLLEVCTKHLYYQLEVELRQIRLQILIELSLDTLANTEYEEYRQLLERITDGIEEEDKENYLQVAYYNIKNLKKLNALPLASRRKDLRNRWNELLYNIVNVNSIERVKFLIEKGLERVLCPASFKLMTYSEQISNFYCFHSYNSAEDEMIPPELQPLIDRAFTTDSLVGTNIQGINAMIIPLISGSSRIGYLLVFDEGELEYTRNEINLMRNIKQHLAALIIRVNDYEQITMRMSKMNELMHISHELMSIVEMYNLEWEIISKAIDFINATRGFLIRLDHDGNNQYRVQMNNRKQPLATVTGISKTAIGLCQATLKPVISYNAQEDQSFKNSISVQDYGIHSIFCCPILINDQPIAWLYFDNMGENSREMYLNEDILSLFQAQVAIAFKNATQYEAVIQKSHELSEFESLKNEFMAIVAHELNTPLTTLQGYVSRLKRKLYADEEEKQDLISKLESSVRKLIISSGDISTMNYYNLQKSLTKAPCDIYEILELVQQEVDILSRKRKMFIKLEVEENLSELYANWEAIHRMVHNVVLNAIRFTNDFGTVVIGARRSVFPTEKINNRESLVIFVQDNGIGIPEYQLKNVFRKFYELNEIYAHKSGTVEYRSSGLGLGLATAKRIAELHGGEITIKSKENEGTTVFMILPFKESKQGFTTS